MRGHFDMTRLFRNDCPFGGWIVENEFASVFKVLQQSLVDSR